MSPPDFSDLFSELCNIEEKLRVLIRKERLRNRLKILGIGFLIYKNIEKEIEEHLSRRQVLLEQLAPSVADLEFDSLALAPIGIG